MRENETLSGAVCAEDNEPALFVITSVGEVVDEYGCFDYDETVTFPARGVVAPVSRGCGGMVGDSVTAASGEPDPVAHLGEVLRDVLDVDSNPARTPDESMGMLREAMSTFQVQTTHWLGVRSG